MTVVVERRLGERVHPANGRHLVYFACRIVAGEPEVVDADEISAIEWCDLATVEERWSGLIGGIFPPVRDYLEQAMGSRSGRSAEAL